MTETFRAECESCPGTWEEAYDNLLKEAAAVEKERDVLKVFCLRSLRVGEWLAGTGYVGDPQCPEDPDNLFLDLVEFLGFETDEECVSALEKLGTPVISQPDKEPDKTCGDCELHQKALPFDFCQMTPQSFFRREASEKACKSFAGASEKEAENG